MTLGEKRTISSVILMILLAIWVGIATGEPFFRPDLAAFYQHQNAHQGVWPPGPRPFPPRPAAPDPEPVPLQPSYKVGPGNHWWETGGGWCGTTAWINSFYFFHKNGFPRLFDHSNLGAAHQGKTWLERFIYANEDLSIRVGLGCASFPRVAAGADLPLLTDIPKYVRDYGYGDSLVYSEYFWDDTAKKVKQRTAAGRDVDAPYATMFDLYYAELLRGSDVLLVLQDTVLTVLNPWWWSTSFHVITGAGVETDAGRRRLSFADPDRGRGGKSAWGHPYTNTDPVPVGGPFYTTAMLAADGRTFDSGPYPGAFISELHILSRAFTIDQANATNVGKIDASGVKVYGSFSPPPTFNLADCTKARLASVMQEAAPGGAGELVAGAPLDVNMISGSQTAAAFRGTFAKIGRVEFKIGRSTADPAKYDFSLTLSRITDKITFPNQCKGNPPLTDLTTGFNLFATPAKPSCDVQFSTTLPWQCLPENRPATPSRLAYP